MWSATRAPSASESALPRSLCEVFGIERLAAQLRVEVGAAGGEPTRPQDLVIGQRHFAVVVGELVGVPAGLVIVPVHVDRPEDPEARGHGKLVLE